jgi:serine/threonine protein phosphatase PrpC
MHVALPSQEDTAFLAQRIQQAFLAAHSCILQEAAQKPEYAGMVTTCVAAMVL